MRLSFNPLRIIHNSPLCAKSDAFIGLNGVRILSIIALILVFASNIVTLVHDIEAVNTFLAEGRTVSSSGQAPNATMEMVMNSDYILCVSLYFFFCSYNLMSKQGKQRAKPTSGRFLGRP